ncbi:MAG: AsmA family protein, partial [Bacteroidota bacterium]|nr:AsmA family protein [Bacteroidota bacterium]
IEDLEVKGNLAGKINYFLSNRRRIFQNQSFDADAGYFFNIKKKQGTFNQAKAIVNGDTLQITGSHTRLPTGAGSQLNITVAGFQPVLPVFRQIMPPTALPTLAKMRSDSRVYLTCKFNGVSGPRMRPRSTINFKLVNGKIYLPENKSLITGVSLVGMLDNGPKHLPETSQLTLSDIKARLGSGFIQMQLSLKNFTQPAFTFQGNGQIDLPTLSQLLPLPLTQANQGLITGNLKINGELPDSLRGSTPNLYGQGDIKLQKAVFQPAGFSVMWRNVNGTFKFSDKDLRLQNLGGLIAGNPFKLQASIKNYLPYLFGQPGQLNAKVDFEAAKLHADWLQGNMYANNSSPENSSNDQLSYNSTSTKYVLASLRFKERKLGKSAQKPISSDGQVNRVLLSLLNAASSQLNVRVGTLHLSDKEALRQLRLQVNQSGRRVKLTNMHFISQDGGKATATGGFQLTKAGIRLPYLNVNLHYDYLNLQRFMQHIADLKDLAPKSDQPLTRSQKRRRAALRENSFWLQLNASANRVEYEYLKGTNLVLRANLNKERAQLSQLSLQAFKGQINSHGIMQLRNPGGTYPLRIQAKITGIDLQQLFVVANQMNLDVLSSENVRGNVECHVSFLTHLDKTFSPAIDRTVAFANATFRDMELIDVAPIQNALSFLRKERTQHLYFDDVKTKFIMQSNQFITPRLSMNSNLTDFELSGRYVMGGGANLNMDINVLNVLFGNNKKRIEKIQNDSVETDNNSLMQHLSLTREQEKYKVKLSNRKDRAANNKALREEFNSILQQHRLDTLFTLNR